MRYVILLVLLLCCETVNAQKNSFTKRKNRWTIVKTHYGSPNRYETVKYTHVKTVTIDTTTWLDFQFGLVTENGLQRKVFVKNLDLSPLGVGVSDTTERVLYDYNLVVGDSTEQVYGTDSFKCFVTKIDSTMVDSVWHRLWYFNSTHYNADTIKDTGTFIVIEGIGTNKGPWFAAYPTEGGYNPLSFGNYTYALTCFYTDTMQPRVNPAVPNMYYPDFDNDWSCSVVYINVEKLSQDEAQVILVPNPANATGKIILPHLMTAGRFEVLNALGQKVYDKQVKGERELLLKSTALQQGMYFYRVSDSQTGRVYTGKFIYE